MFGCNRLQRERKCRETGRNAPFKSRNPKRKIAESNRRVWSDAYWRWYRRRGIYNLGGGKDNSCSLLEAFQIIENISGKKMVYDYTEVNRKGDHICYYSDLSKMKKHYPNWSITKSLDDIFNEINLSWQSRKKK